MGRTRASKAPAKAQAKRQTQKDTPANKASDTAVTPSKGRGKQSVAKGKGPAAKRGQAAKTPEVPKPTGVQKRGAND